LSDYLGFNSPGRPRCFPREKSDEIFTEGNQMKRIFLAATVLALVAAPAMAQRSDTGPANQRQDAGPANQRQDAGPANQRQDAGPANQRQDSGPANQRQDAGPANQRQDTGPANKK
jgi:hypothetical protein